MNQAMVDNVVQAVLYEGYNLYPYRPSVKNRCRWTFGGLVPRQYSEAAMGTEAWNMEVQCLLQAEDGAPPTSLEVQVRFLHLVQRTIGVLPAACDELPAGEDPEYQPVESLMLDGTRYQSWQEAVQRDVAIGPLETAALAERAAEQSLAIPAGHAVEPLRNAEGRIVAVAVRDQQSLAAVVTISAERLDASIFRLTVRVLNQSQLDNAGQCGRDEALLRSLVAAHVVLIAREGKFFSLTDPPEALREAADACRNRGAWPVLVGEPGAQDAMLASPIILYDYPRIAPESPGDLFDGTEIDELLSLRIMTLTDEEKAMAAATDDRTRRLIERTESLAREQFAGLHGAIRSFEPCETDLRARPADKMDSAVHPDTIDDDPFFQGPAIESIVIDDVVLRPGDRVRLRPGLGGDIFDLVLSGKTATIESIEQDFEDRFHVAVTLDDDPGQDLGQARQPGHRFFFKPEELAPLSETGVVP